MSVPTAVPLSSASGTAAALLTTVVDAFRTANELRALLSTHGVRGYVVVGSTALGPIDASENSDIDIVLLSAAASPERPRTGEVLGLVCAALLPLAGTASLWVVETNTLSVLKVAVGDVSLDILLLDDCTFAPPCDTEESFLCFDCVEDHDQLFFLPSLPVPTPTLNSILLARRLRMQLEMEHTSFTRELLGSVRAWARARHLYGTRYG